tara:strand:- start:28 stop:213 length:186 start_codon:yes stop_codon:yes gene_type:complete
MLLDDTIGFPDEEHLRVQWVAMYSALLRFMSLQDLEKMLDDVSEGTIDKFNPLNEQVKKNE